MDVWSPTDRWLAGNVLRQRYLIMLIVSIVGDQSWTAKIRRSRRSELLLVSYWELLLLLQSWLRLLVLLLLLLLLPVIRVGLLLDRHR